jgi:uncharacterized protein involved in exopolysaccharide biosynthesis
MLVAEGGADVSAADRWGNTPLAEATRAGAAAVTQYLTSDEARQAVAKARQAAEQRLAVGSAGSDLASLHELGGSH